MLESHFPRGVKEVLLNCPKDGITGGSSLKNDGFIKVISFLKGCIHCHDEDHEYSWNLWQTARSSYILAASFLLDGRVMDAMFMIFYGAFMRDCLSVGVYNVFDFIMNRLRMELFREMRSTFTWVSVHVMKRSI